MSEPRLRFLGYGVRRTEVPPASVFSAAGLDELCSVSACVARRPEGWLQSWDFNRACCYPTEAIALATAAGAPGFTLLAYSLVESKLDEVGNEILVNAEDVFVRGLPDLPPAGAAPEGFAPLGYDVVACEPGQMDFTHSPLSCNGLAGEISVNRHCLLDDRAAALRLAQRWDRERPEPGPYFVVQVARRPAG